jgi:hypothetical protein
MLLCESSIAALYTDYRQGGDKYLQVRTALERERLAVPPDSEYAREIEFALKSLDEVFAPRSEFETLVARFIRPRP